MIAFSEILDTIAHAPIQKRAMTNLGVLNEAYAYAKPSSFSRGMRIDLILASAPIAERVQWAVIDRNARKGKQPSDHAPVVIDL